MDAVIICNDGINYQTDRRKLTLQELVNLIESQGYSETDVSKYY